ncbi:MAG: hypothetical protein FWH37_06120 [Candidatus Bathyarchaeota archaeon]|nr:hypothetical protein [Candidatus Termiticorpusculum sp.]
MSKCYTLLFALYITAIIMNNELMRKNKVLIKFISILLICTIVFSMFPLFFGNYASASNSVGAANFSPNVAYYDFLILHTKNHYQ